MAAPDQEGQGSTEIDVEAIHRPLIREPLEPAEGRERPPWWLWALVGIALFSGGFYLGRYSGDFGINAHVGYLPRTPSRAEPVAKHAEKPASGAELYQQHCATCHQADGAGIPNTFPPLVGSPWVLEDVETLIRILLHGLSGPIEVAGSEYNGVMPAWASVLNDAELAAVATHIRQLGANEALPVESEAVSKLRQAAERTEPWTVEALRAARGTP